MPIYAIERNLNFGPVVILGKIGDVITKGIIDLEKWEGPEGESGTLAIINDSKVEVATFWEHYLYDPRERISGIAINKSKVRGHLRFMDQDSAKGRRILFGTILPF